MQNCTVKITVASMIILIFVKTILNIHYYITCCVHLHINTNNIGKSYNIDILIEIRPRCWSKNDIIGRSWIKMYARLCRGVGFFKKARGIHRNMGLYMLLHVLKNIWLDLSMNFVLGLPHTRIASVKFFFSLKRWCICMVFQRPLHLTRM